MMIHLPVRIHLDSLYSYKGLIDYLFISTKLHNIFQLPDYQVAPRCSVVLPEVRGYTIQEYSAEYWEYDQNRCLG